METIVIDEQHFLAFRDTPWDTRAFGFKTNEISSVEGKTERALKALLKKFDEHNINKGVEFTYIRIDSANRLLKKALQESGFYYAETSLYTTMNDVQGSDLDHFVKNDITLEIPSENDFAAIKDMARDAFNHSRFHEDPYIGIEKARHRYYLWIEDLILQKKDFLVYKSSGEMVSFMAYGIEDGVVDLILGGSLAGKGWVSYYFYAAMMKHFKDRQVRKAKTIVSASNNGIINVYSKLGFTFEKTLIGFHKFYQ